MKRYEKFVLEAEKGITFEVSEGTSGELIIRALNIATVNVCSTNYALNIDTVNVCSTNYVNPPIPEGYKHVCGEWNNGFVIERCSDGSQFVWIPVGSLDSNGTLDGEHFSEKFGRRNYMKNNFSDDEYHEALNKELLEQLESVKKYGGFYISRYNISKSSEGKPRSVKGVMPWVRVTFDDAQKIASTIEDNEAVKSHLTFGAEYDSVLEWFIKTKVKTLAEIAEDSTDWGNYWNTVTSAKEKVETGSGEEWCANNIYDFAGNVEEWTQEQYDSSWCWRVARGGDYSCSGYYSPVAYRRCDSRDADYYGTGFRATLYIK
jgi:formylglycine-generating enzyme required for sulfatase activity